MQLIGVELAEFAAPLTNGLVRHSDPACEQQFLNIAVAQTKAEVQPDAMADDFNGETMMLVMVWKGWCVHGTNIAHQTTVVQARQ
jgi:hypothetical protein